MEAQARQLRLAGYDVRLIAGRGRGDLIGELYSRHPEVERVTGALAAGAAPGEEFELLRRRICQQLGNTIRDRDLVIVHNVLTMPFNLPLVAALLDLGRPLLAWTHDLATNDTQYAAYQRPEWPFSLLARPQPHVTYVAISRLRQVEIARTFGLAPRQIPVIPNGIDPLEFAGLGARARSLLRRAGALEAAPLVLVPLRVTPRKRLELVLEAAAEVRRRLPGLRVLVTGPLGPHNPANRQYGEWLLEERARLGLEEVVRFLFEQAVPGGEHPVRTRDMSELYRVSDAVLVTSAAEGFGLPVLEAALARVPVVCADLPVLREVGGRAVHTFPAGAGGREVADVVERVIALRPVRERRRTIRRYSWPVVIARTERVIKTAVAS